MKHTTLRLLLVAGLLGTSARALAQVELSGSWTARNYGKVLDTNPLGPVAVEYQGIPLNEAARARALSYSQSMASMPDRMCSFYNPIYLMLGPFGLKIWNETEPRNGTTIAWHLGGWEDMAPLTIWMDGRPHPSQHAPHPTGGFTTGTWQDDVLVADTTHMKAGVLRRNGVPSSDQAVMRTRFSRHGDLLTVTTRVEDPIYLAEAFVLTRVFELSSGPSIQSLGPPCIPADEGVPEGVVPHYLPGKNPFIDEMTRVFHIPVEAVLGGPETMYPDIRKRWKDQFVVPERCLRACGGPVGR